MTPLPDGIRSTKQRSRYRHITIQDRRLGMLSQNTTPHRQIMRRRLRKKWSARINIGNLTRQTKGQHRHEHYSIKDQKLHTKVHVSVNKLQKAVPEHPSIGTRSPKENFPPDVSSAAVADIGGKIGRTKSFGWKFWMKTRGFC